MNTIEELRPDLRPLDAEWSAVTLAAILAGETATGSPSPSARPTRRRVAVGAALAAVLVGGFALRPEAAFAVKVQDDGDVVVTIRSLEDAAGLERALEAQGVNAEVAYVATEPELRGAAQRAPDEDSGPSRTVKSDEAPPPSGGAGCLTMINMQVADDGVTFTLAAASVRSDAVLHITTMGEADGWSGLGVQWEGGPC